MYEIISAVLFLTAAVCGGKMIADKQRRKCSYQKTVILFLTALRSRLVITRTPLGELITELDKNGHMPYFVKSCAEKLIDGEAFPDAWKNGICADIELEKSDMKNTLLILGSSLGTTSVDGQISQIDLCISEAGEILEKENEKCRRYSGMFPALGLLAGVWAAVIII